MTRSIKASLTHGLAPHPRPGRVSTHAPRLYESYERRAHCLMCEDCIKGRHAECDSELCPCVCNDSDFRFARNKLTAIGAIPPGALSDHVLSQLLHRA